MNKIINIETKISDEKKAFLVKIDTEKNDLSIYSKYDDQKFDYHLTAESTLLSDLVDELKDVTVDGRIISGNQALELSKNGRFEDVAKGLLRSFGKKNLFFTLTCLFGKFKKKVKTDIPLKDLIKIITSEAVDPEKWTMNIY